MHYGSGFNSSLSFTMHYGSGLNSSLALRAAYSPTHGGGDTSKGVSTIPNVLGYLVASPLHKGPSSL